MAIDRFDPVLSWASTAYSCFLKNSLCSRPALIIQLLIVSKSKPENASSGPSSHPRPPLVVPAGGGGLTPLSCGPRSTCDHFQEELGLGSSGVSLPAAGGESLELLSWAEGSRGRGREPCSAEERGGKGEDMGTSGGDREVILNELLDKVPFQKSLLPWPGSGVEPSQCVFPAAPGCKVSCAELPSWRCSLAPSGVYLPMGVVWGTAQIWGHQQHHSELHFLLSQGPARMPRGIGNGLPSSQMEHVPREILIATQVRLLEVDTMAARREPVGDGPSWASSHHC